jgi:hypothetical protein
MALEGCLVYVRYIYIKKIYASLYTSMAEESPYKGSILVQLKVQALDI